MKLRFRQDDAWGGTDAYLSDVLDVEAAPLQGQTIPFGGQLVEIVGVTSAAANRLGYDVVSIRRASEALRERWLVSEILKLREQVAQLTAAAAK